MPALSCKTCSKPDAKTCLACGHAYCSMHRGDLDGIPTCAECLREAQERKRRAVERKRKAAERAQEAEARKAGNIGAATAAATADRPLPPLPEPAGSGPILWGVKAAVPTAIYFWVFLGWLARTHELPAWVRPSGTLLFTAVAFAGVWAIAKTRASSPGGP